MKTIKYKQLQYDGNCKVIELKVIGYIKLKNSKSNFEFADSIRIVAEPLPGFSGATTIVIDGEKISIGRIYKSTLDKLLSKNINDDFTDTNGKKWIKVDFKFDDKFLYTEENIKAN